MHSDILAFSQPKRLNFDCARALVSAGPQHLDLRRQGRQGRLLPQRCRRAHQPAHPPGARLLQHPSGDSVCRLRQHWFRRPPDLGRRPREDSFPSFPPHRQRGSGSREPGSPPRKCPTRICLGGRRARRRRTPPAMRSVQRRSVPRILERM